MTRDLRNYSVAYWSGHDMNRYVWIAPDESFEWAILPSGLRLTDIVGAYEKGIPLFVRFLRVLKDV